jgi:hypothetical protein
MHHSNRGLNSRAIVEQFGNSGSVLVTLGGIVQRVGTRSRDQRSSAGPQSSGNDEKDQR